MTVPPWLVALLVTLASEVPLVAALFPGQRVKMAAVAVAANVATNLLLNLVLLRRDLLGGPHLMVGEVFAVMAEAAAYSLASRPRNIARSVLASSLANALSFSLGLVPALQPLLRH